MKISLESVASIINDNLEGTGLKVYVKEVYWDYGAGIKWKTIVVTGDATDYQLIYPDEMKILLGEDITQKMDLTSKLIGRIKRMVKYS